MENSNDLKDTDNLDNTDANNFQKTSTFATLVPDEILQHASAPGKERRRFECVLLLADVSGFTALCELYASTGKGGTYRMTKTLNSYIGEMVQEIMNYGGDVLKFSGDAFLACWKVDSAAKMINTVNKVVKCTLYIQSVLGEFQTDANVALKVKLAISAGTATFSVIGNEEVRHYIIVGEPITEVRLAEYMCVSGDIVLSPSAWKFCNSKNYVYSKKGDLGHIKIIKEIDGEKRNQNARKDSADWVSVRPIVMQMAREQDESLLRPFIIPPVLQQVDYEQPLDYLTEMRQVVSMFVNVITFHIPVDQFISLVDDVYCIICRFTQESSGCVNKVSLFDKDLMFLVLFGLRGYKHEMEIKKALRCAANCQNVIALLKGVKTVSAGLSSGMTYCGVVGHPMRKEYTVIGSSVNKAARLMVAYPGRVSCGRNTFLQSKLPLHYFHLLETKELKGLSSVGPIYEFIEEEIRRNFNYEGPKFPLLGRNKELRFFISKLNALKNQHKKQKGTEKEQNGKYTLHSGIAFHGDSRIGKTRLLEELADISRERDTPALIIPLTSSHRRSPYASAAYLFQLLIGIDDAATTKEKEEIILSYFGFDLLSDELCYLNDIFQVKFMVTSEYKNESNMEKLVKREFIAKELFKTSCSSVAPLVVLALDDIHNMDPSSASLFSSFLDLNGSLIVVTATGDISYETSAIEKDISEGSNFFGVGESQVALGKFYNHPRLFRYPLDGLNPEFMAPLACQILDVRGIPPELELVLQNESQGNPGWIENYLVSLMQTGALILSIMDMSDPKHEMLIFPKEELITQLETTDMSPPKIYDDTDCSDETTNFDCLSDEKKKDEFSYKQVFLDISDKKMIESVAGRRICILAPNFNLEEANINKTMNAVVMNAFDSLDPFSQLLVKIASVLGNICMRVMLVDVMNNPGIKKVAEAVKNVFDARILCCGRPFGKTKPQPLLLGEKKSFKPECRCHEGYRLNVGVNLPKYAFCSLMKFTTPLYRDTAYDLLTDDQKKDLHSRAANFLETEAHRCVFCGGGPFFNVPALFAPLSVWLSAFEGGTSVINEDHAELYPYINKESKNNQATERIAATKRIEQEHKNLFENIELLKISSSPSVMARNITPSANDVKSSQIIKTSQSLTQCYTNPTNEEPLITRCDSDKSLGVCLSRVDFSLCECHLILSTIYIHMIEHTRSAGLNNKLIPFLIEFGISAVPYGISTQAAKLLQEAEELLLEMTNVNTTSKQESTWFALGKIRELQGQALYDLGQRQNALSVLLSALDTLGYEFPKGKVQMTVSLAKASLKQWMNQKFNKSSFDAAFGSRALYNALSECLSLICQIKMEENNWLIAELAATESLNMAERTRNNFLALTRGYCDCLEFSMNQGNVKECCRLEAMALQLCRKMSRKVTTDRRLLIVLARLYYVTFRARFLRGEVDAATRVGFRALKLNNKMFKVASARLQILPLLVQALFIRRRFAESVEMLQELAHVAEEESNSSGATWYHALCLDLMLETGYCLEDYATCKIYADEVMDSMNTSSFQDESANRRLIVGLWLWCIRCERWEEAKSLEGQRGFSIGISSVTAAISSLGLSNDAVLSKEENSNLLLLSIQNVVVGLKYLEGLQLILVGKLNIRGYKSIPEIYNQIMHVTDVLKKVTRIATMAKPRLIHLRAHVSIIKARTAHSMNLMRKAATLCKKHGNLLEASWVEHNKKVWLGLVGSHIKNFWKDRSNEKDVDWHKIELMKLSSIMFTLPIPKNFL